MSTAFTPLALGVFVLGGLILLGAANRPATDATPPPAATDAGPELFALEHWELSEQAARGRAVYEQSCIGCHGDTGLGDGLAGAWLDPKPRNFQRGAFKFRSTPSGELPTLDDVVHVITCGLQGSAMRSFPLMPERQRQDVAKYVLELVEFGLMKYEVDDLILSDDMTLAEVFEEEYEELYEETVFDAWEEVWPVQAPLAPDRDEESLEIGRALYEKQCVACHGATGKGDGSSSFSLRDWKDAPIRARDFTSGVFRAGSSPADIWKRLRTGLNGTPMPAIYGSDEDLWHLTHYILSLKDPDAPGRLHPTACENHDGGSAEGADR